MNTSDFNSLTFSAFGCIFQYADFSHAHYLVYSVIEFLDSN